MDHCLRRDTRGSASSEYLVSALLVGLLGVTGFASLGQGMGKDIADGGPGGRGRGAVAVARQAAEGDDRSAKSGGSLTQTSGRVTRSESLLGAASGQNGATGEQTQTGTETSSGGTGTPFTGTRGSSAEQTPEGQAKSLEDLIFEPLKGKGTSGYGNPLKRLWMLMPFSGLFTSDKQEKKEIKEMHSAAWHEISQFPKLIVGLGNQLSTMVRHGDWEAVKRMGAMFSPRMLLKMFKYDWDALNKGDMKQAGRGGLYTLMNFQWIGGGELLGAGFRGGRNVIFGERIITEGGELARSSGLLTPITTRLRVGDRLASLNEAVTTKLIKGLSSADGKFGGTQRGQELLKGLEDWRATFTKEARDTRARARIQPEFREALVEYGKVAKAMEQAHDELKAAVAANDEAAANLANTKIEALVSPLEQAEVKMRNIRGF